jgi:hypothetical protein
MRGIKLSVLLGAIGVVGLTLWAGAKVDRAGGRMAVAAERLLAALGPDAKGKATFGFDDPERLNWHFIPRERKGLPLKEMSPEQRALAFGLLETGVGAAGSLKATTIMSLEAILREIEKGQGPVRDPERYFVSIFGTPSNTGKWGWRIEGHHLSLNFTLDGGKIVAATPAFFGANPAEVREGPRQGLRTLGEIEDNALRLFQALDADQQKTALLAAEAPRDIASNSGQQGPNGGLPARTASQPEGVAFGDLNESQRDLMKALVESHAVNLPDEVASAWLDEIVAAGPEQVRFGWYGPADRSQPHAYKVQGPTFLIEFNNTQNNANHIHSVWRHTLGDFGLAAAR